jgi:predicted permease
VILDHLWSDLRLAWRGLARARSFTLAAIVTLAVGIAGTTVMFSLVRGVLLRPLPVRDQDRLIVSWKELPATGFTHHPFDSVAIEAVSRDSRLFEAVAGVDANEAGRTVVNEDGASTYVNSATVTGGFFEVLGIDAALGRRLEPRDDVEGAESVVAISHGLWTRRYGQARDVIGRRIDIGGVRFAIVGVMPPDLEYPARVEIWRTAHSFSTSGPFGDAARRELDLIARLRPGVTREQAFSELATMTRQLETARPGTTRGLVPVVRSFEEAVVGSVRSSLILLLAAVALVLLIATANVANLLLMRGESRRAELALREAVGAGRGRIVRELIAESLMISLAAAGAGLTLSAWSLGAIVAAVPGGMPRIDSIRIDGAVVAFCLVTAVMASSLAALAPVLSVNRLNLAAQLRSGGRGATARGARRVRRGLVVGQVAVAVLVVAAASVLTRTLLRLQSADPGFAGERLVFVELAPPPDAIAGRAQHAQFLEQAIERLQSAPPIAAATPINVMPFSGDGGWDVPRFTAEGQGADRADTNPSLNLESIYPNYFETLQVRLTQGRAFTRADREGGLRVAILSRDVADRTWPGENPIGRRIKFGGPDSGEAWMTVVGVAETTRYRDLARPRPTLYLPAAQFLETAETFVLRTTATLDLAAALVRDRMRDVDPRVNVVKITPYRRALEAPLARPRFNALLLGIFAAVALLLSAIGLYAVMAAFVRQRDREIAVRMALGATPANVHGLVLRDTAWLAGLGAAAGVLTAASATRLLRGVFHEIEALDPPTLGAAALLLVATSVLASLVPMRRASRVDAVAVLRD